MSGVSFTLPAGQAIEQLTPVSYTSTTPLNLAGNGLARSIVGNAGNNVIDGRGGADVLQGLGGSDTFVFHKGAADGNQIVDFSGDGLGTADILKFIGYGTTAEGANIVRLDSMHWPINAFDGSAHDTITLLNSANINSHDYFFT